MDLKYKNGVASLFINEVFPEDDGEYVCKALNTMGATETKCILKVKRKFKQNCVDKIPLLNHT